MPSASAKLEKQASQEVVDPIKQILTVIEHKKRNLEKRKTKLETYREDQKNGKELKGEQLAAVQKYDEVCKTLEFAAEMAKMVQGISADHAKNQKKQQRKEQLERVAGEMARVKELLIIQDAMMNLGNDVVRADFLAGKDGAALLTSEEISYLDDLYPLLNPKHEEGTLFAQQVAMAADHFMALMEGRGKEVIGTTYATIRDVMQRINDCGYFDQNVQKLNPEYTPGQEIIGGEEVVETTGVDTPVVENDVEEVIAPVAAPVPAPQGVIAAAPLPVQSTEQHPPAPIAGVPYYAGQVVANPPQFPPAISAQQPIPPATTIPVAHRPSPPQPHTRPITEVIGQTNSSFNFIQESQVEVESPANVDIAVMLQYPPAGGPAALPPGRNPAAPAASAVPQPDFHAIPTQTFTNQNFPLIGGPQAVASTVPSSSAPAVPVAAAHIPAYPPQQNTSQLNYHSQELPSTMPMPPSVTDVQVKVMQSTNVPAAPASFAQAAQAYNSQPKVPTNYVSSAPPGFGTAPLKPASQQSHFQPLPSQEQVEEQDRADEKNSWANEENSWANEAGEAQDGDQGYRESGYRGRGGRGRGRGNKFSGRGRGGQGQQNGGRSGGYQGRGGQYEDRGNENGLPPREHGGSSYKRGGGPSRDGSGASGRGQGYRGSGGPFRGNSNSGNRSRGGGGGGPPQGVRSQQNVKP